MANCIMAFPNYVDNDFYDVVLTGGDWDLPLENLKNTRLNLPAKSNGVTTAATCFQVDLGTLRNISVAVLPSTNATLSCQVRVQISNTPSFSLSTVVGASGTTGDSSVTMKAPAGSDITVSEDDFFKIDGFLYKCDADVTITAGNTGAVTLASATGNDIHYATLQSDVATDDPVVCVVGDHSSPLYDSTLGNLYSEISAFGSESWGDETLWTGLPTNEQRAKLKFPHIEIIDDELIIGQYIKYIFEDTTNSDTGLAISRLFIAPGWSPTINLSYGSGIQYDTDTTFEESFGGEPNYSVKQSYRKYNVSIDHLTLDEALGNALTMQRDQGIHGQIFFIEDPDYTGNLHLTSFVATLSSLNPLTHTYFNHMDFNAVLKEVKGGLLV